MKATPLSPFTPLVALPVLAGPPSAPPVRSRRQRSFLCPDGSVAGTPTAAGALTLAIASPALFTCTMPDGTPAGVATALGAGGTVTGGATGIEAAGAGTAGADDACAGDTGALAGAETVGAVAGVAGAGALD